jgi:hypothetical protein
MDLFCCHLLHVDGESGGGQLAANACWPAPAPSPTAMLFLAQFLHPLRDGIELSLQPLGLSP